MERKIISACLQRETTEYSMQLESDGKLFNCVLGDGHAQEKKKLIFHVTPHVTPFLEH